MNTFVDVSRKKNILSIFMSTQNSENEIDKEGFVSLTKSKVENIVNNRHDTSDEDTLTEIGRIDKIENYKPPKFSPSFLAHRNSLADKHFSTYQYETIDEGVRCPGEPAMDPSRFVKDNGLDSEWLEETF